MAEVLTDERVAGLLRPFVRAAVPVLRTLRESDPLRLRRRFRGAGASERPAASEPRAGAADGLAEDGGRGGPPGRRGAETGRVERLMRRLDVMEVPGSSAWDAMTLEQRCDWWAGRVGRLLAVVAGLPRFGGVITSKLPIRNALGTVGQALVLSAIAAEHGVHEQDRQVRMIAKVVLDRDLTPELAAGQGEQDRARDDERAAELTRDLDGSAEPGGKAIVRTVWRMARTLWEIDSELDKRPQGRFYHEAIGSVPVVGVVGGYLGERSALRRVARHGARWLRREGTAGG